MRSARVLLAPALHLLLLCGLARAQTDEIPQRTDQNLIVASYNIKWLGNLPKDFDGLAEVIQHFDVCGVQEVKRESRMRELAAALKQKTGKEWGYVFGSRTARPGGTYHEAYGAVWRKDRVELGNGIVGGVWDRKEAYRNDPYLVSFKAGNFDFALLLVHTRWSNDAEGTRAGEVADLTDQVKFYRGILEEKDFIVAGDFNYPGTAQPMKDFADETDMTQLDGNEKSTYKTDGTGYASSYDHIYAWSDEETAEFVDGRCRVMDATKIAYGSDSVANMNKSRDQLSDHLPVWAVFDVSGPDDD